MKKHIAFLLTLISAIGLSWIATAKSPQAESTSSVYAGHGKNGDIQNFLRQYPKAAGTRLDDCQTCHRGGVEGTDTEREFNPCGYCHLTRFPNAKYKTGVPGNYEATLNAYGIAYKQKGAIANLDSDVDGYQNTEEIADLRYPGDAASRPGQPMAPIVTLSWEKMRKLPVYKQFMLINPTSQPIDEYASFAGVRIKDVLEAAGVNLAGAAGITIFAPDGYSVDCTIEDINNPFPRGYFYAAPGTITEKEKVFVQYPESIPPGVLDGKEIPDTPWLLLAFERDGKPLSGSYYEKETGKIGGEGPYRLVRPQRTVMVDPVKPGRPDRSDRGKQYGDGWDFMKEINHNAGACVRGASVIRINPMPKGLEEHNWKNSWSLVDRRQIVIFGRGVTHK
jgi:hypothetical protein